MRSWWAARLPVMFSAMTNTPSEWFIDPSKPWRGVHRRISIACELPLAEWSSVRAIIASTPPEDMSRRAFWPAMTFSCEWCGALNRRPVYQMRKAEKVGAIHLFCGHRCQMEAFNAAHPRTRKVRPRKPRLNLVQARLCEVCSLEFKPPNRATPGRFCSRVCKDRGHSMDMVGEQNPGWRNGANSARLQKHSARSFRKAKPEIIRRDGFRCVVCAATEALHVHHIDMDASNNRWRNLATLCAACHMKWHGAERSIPKLILWPWLSEYASQPRSSTSKWREPTAFSQMAS